MNNLRENGERSLSRRTLLQIANVGEAERNDIEDSDKWVTIYEGVNPEDVLEWLTELLNDMDGDYIGEYNISTCWIRFK